MKIYKTKEEFVNEQDNLIRQRIKSVLNTWLENTDGKDILHDSDIEDLKFALEEVGVYITWEALYKFLGIWDDVQV